MRLSKEKRERIAENILFMLYQEFPQAFFTAQIARELVRDEEFIKSLLVELEKKGLVISIRKSPKGVPYSRRIRWRLSRKAYQAYKKKLG